MTAVKEEVLRLLIPVQTFLQLSQCLCVPTGYRGYWQIQHVKAINNARKQFGVVIDNK